MRLCGIVATGLLAGGASLAAPVEDEDLPDPTPLALGESVEGSLAEGDLLLPRGELCDEYAVEGEKGQTVSIRMSSDEFDTYLIFLDPDADEPQIDNDDFGASQNSGLDVELTTTGVFIIGATSYAAGSVGDYTLSVALAEPED
jgi:hypothetical protein